MTADASTEHEEEQYNKGSAGKCEPQLTGGETS